MACKCINQDGSLSDKCYGTCKKDIILEQEEQQRDPLNGFAELILKQVDQRIDFAINKFHVKVQRDFYVDLRHEYTQGFKDGFEFAKDNGYD